MRSGVGEFGEENKGGGGGKVPRILGRKWWDEWWCLGREEGKVKRGLTRFY